MPNPRIPRVQYQAMHGNSLLHGMARKLGHALARNMPFPRVRRALHRRAGVGVASGVTIGLDSYIDDQFAGTVSLDEGCTLEPRVAIVVHDDTGVTAGGPGDYWQPHGFGHMARVTVGPGAIVGARSVLLPGVIVGEKAIVRPGSVVSRDIEACAVAGGAPARSVGTWRSGEQESNMALLPPNFILQEEYDARVPKSWLRLAYQYAMLLLARFMLPTRLRVALYRAMGARVGRDVYIGVDTYLDERYPELITFEDLSGPSFRSTYITHGETYDASGQRVRFVAPIVVKRGAWAGSNVVVCPGVTIGREAMVGSGSVITEDVPDYAVVVGNPARVIKFRGQGEAGQPAGDKQAAANGNDQPPLTGRH